MSVFPPGDPRNDNSPPGIQWMSDPSDTEKIARLERDLLAANLHAVAVKKERDELRLDYNTAAFKCSLWRDRCKAAQRYLTALINLCDYEEAIVPDNAKVARDAGKDE